VREHFPETALELQGIANDFEGHGYPVTFQRLGDDESPRPRLGIQKMGETGEPAILHGTSMNISDIYWLVVWNIFYFSIYIGNVIIPTDFDIFRGVETTNQYTRPSK